MQFTPAAAAALDVLGHLAAAGEPKPAVSIARDLGMPRSTTYRLLATLVDRGYVVHLPESGRYGLGVGVYELGWAYQRQAPLQRAARPVLARLVDATTHSAHLAIMHGKDVLYVIEERAPGRPWLVSDVGVRLPAELTASGLAMLAALTTTQVSALYPDRAALVRRTETGPTTVTQLRRMLTDVRARGFALEEDSVTPGLSSVALPALDHAGYPVAAVAVTFSGAEVDESARRTLVEQVRRAVAAISARLGSTSGRSSGIGAGPARGTVEAHPSTLPGAT